MEPPGNDISRMSPDELMALVRRLGLLPDVNRLIWEKLVEKGMYEGSPNPEIPYENKYPREKILGMDTWTNWFVGRLGLWPEVKQLIVAEQRRPLSEIPVTGGAQFMDLPAELQVDILGRVSPTAREGVLVSRQMRAVADMVLMANIRAGDLVDPTIGIPERDQYFKLDARGNGEYFSPEPGLWRSVKKYRTERLGDPKTTSRRSLAGGADIKFTVRNVPLLFYGTIHNSENNLVTGKFVSLVMIDSDLSNYILNYEFYSIDSASPYGNNQFEFDAGSSGGEAGKLVAYLTGGTESGVRKYALPLSVTDRVPGLRPEYVVTRVISLTNELVYSGQLIFPSVRDDVLTL